MALVEEELSEKVIGCCIRVHRELGPGFLEKVYEEATAHELAASRLNYAQQHLLRIHFRGIVVGEHRLDLFVENRLVLELKAARSIEDVHLATTLSYLKASGAQIGLVVNFATARLQVRRVVKT